MASPAKLDELNYAVNPTHELLKRLGYAYAPREALAVERAVI